MARFAEASMTERRQMIEDALAEASLGALPGRFQGSGLG